DSLLPGFFLRIRHSVRKFGLPFEVDALILRFCPLRIPDKAADGDVIRRRGSEDRSNRDL
ncbi:MAG: hypothetical protein ACK58T_20705, partial [Phycisphaerae bacterium]